MRRAHRFAALGSLDLLVHVRSQFGESGQGAGRDLVALGGEVDREVLLHPGRRLRQHDDPLAKVDGLVDVMRDEEDRHPPIPVQCPDEILEIGAGLRVDGREGLVHDQHLGLIGDGARDRHALLHSSGELPRVALRRMVEADRDESIVDQPVTLGAARASCA